MARKYKRVTDEQWQEITDKYLLGASAKELSEEYDVAESTISTRFTRLGISKRLTTALAAPTPIVPASSSHSASALPSIPTGTELTAEEVTQRIRTVRQAGYYDALQLQQIIRATISALPTPTSIRESAAIAKTVESLTNSLGKVYRVAEKALQMDRENADADAILPELPIREMTDIEVRIIRHRQELEDGGAIFDDDGNIIPDSVDDDVEPDDHALDHVEG